MISELQALFQHRRTERVGSVDTGMIQIGLECRPAGSPYHWNGRDRGGDRQRPALLLQFTLAGSGYFEPGRPRGSRRRRSTRFSQEAPPGGLESAVSVGPDQGFSALIPSIHRYGVYPEGEAWTFFWVMIWHPEFVQRLKGRVRPVNRVWSGSPADPLRHRAAGLFTDVTNGRLDDFWSREEAVFAVILECERRASGSDPRHPWAARLETMVARNWSDHPPIETLSDAFGLSRTAFSHAFRKRTGMAPAYFIRQLRMTEAERLLKTTTLSVKEIATAVGFSSPDQFGKVFRIHFGVSPRKFRQWFD